MPEKWFWPVEHRFKSLEAKSFLKSKTKLREEASGAPLTHTCGADIGQHWPKTALHSFLILRFPGPHGLCELEP